MRILWLVDREPYADEDTFRGIIVESWRDLRRRPQQTERIEEGFVNLLAAIFIYFIYGPYAAIVRRM